MSDTTETQAVRNVVAETIATEGWGPAELLTWAKGTEGDELFLAAVMLSRLCQDPIARTDRGHGVLHRGYGLAGHAGPELVAATQRGLGLSDARAAALIERLDAEARATAGLTSSED